MELHRNAKLGLSGRFALVQARERGLSVREVARRFSVSPATVSRWSCRWDAASQEERRSLACLFDRSSRPRRMSRMLPAREQRRICAARRQTGWGPRLLTVRTGHPHSTISKVLKRNGLSRPPRAAREPERRYEWPCPGELLTDRRIRHLTTRPRRPRTNGKVERFHQTMAREWAYGLRYRSSRHRAAALPHWLRYYNEHRPHSSLGGLPPISRVHNVRGQDS